MRRSKLKQIAGEIAAEAKQKSYEYWANTESPISYLREVGGERLAVELVLLEKNNAEYVQIGVYVGDANCHSLYGLGRPDVELACEWCV